MGTGTEQSQSWAAVSAGFLIAKHLQCQHRNKAENGTIQAQPVTTLAQCRTFESGLVHSTAVNRLCCWRQVRAAPAPDQGHAAHQEHHAGRHFACTGSQLAVPVERFHQRRSCPTQTRWSACLQRQALLSGEGMQLVPRQTRIPCQITCNFLTRMCMCKVCNQHIYAHRRTGHNCRSMARFCRRVVHACCDASSTSASNCRQT